MVLALNLEDQGETRNDDNFGGAKKSENDISISG